MKLDMSERVYVPWSRHFYVVLQTSLMFNVQLPSDILAENTNTAHCTQQWSITWCCWVVIGIPHTYVVRVLYWNSSAARKKIVLQKIIRARWRFAMTYVPRIFRFFFLVPILHLSSSRKRRSCNNSSKRLCWKHQRSLPFLEFDLTMSASKTQ